MDHCFSERQFVEVVDQRESERCLVSAIRAASAGGIALNSSPKSFYLNDISLSL